MNLQDYLTIVGSILGPMLTLMGFMWHHSNSRFDKMEEKLGADIKDVKSDIKDVKSDIKDVKSDIKDVRVDIKRVEEKLGADIKRVEEKLGADIKRVEEKVDAVRDRVSRIEGQLVPAKVISFEETRPKPSARPNHSKVAEAQ